VKKLLLVSVLVVVGLILVLGVLGCHPLDGCGTEPEPSVRLLSASVNPSSGTGGFELVVDYEWRYNGPGSTPQPDRIRCYYVDPDSNSVYIGNIDPAAESSGYTLNEPGWIKGHSTLPFDVRPPNGPAKPGTYAAECFTGYPPAARASFVVTETKEDTTTTSTATQVKVYRLEINLDMQQGSAPQGQTGLLRKLHLAYEGEIIVNVDGSLSGELPGALDGTALARWWEKEEGSHDFTYKIDVPMTVTIGGSAEASPGGQTLHVFQTVSEYKVNPVSDVSGYYLPYQLSDQQNDIDGSAPAWLEGAMTELVLEIGSTPVEQALTAGAPGWATKWSGTVSLSPVR
jgi:hypothetical protein